MIKLLIKFGEVKNWESEIMPGMVYLIGAGPGDYRLITLKGRECLEAADVVVYDYAEISENGAVSFRCGYRRDWLKNRETG